MMLSLRHATTKSRAFIFTILTPHNNPFSCATSSTSSGNPCLPSTPCYGDASIFTPNDVADSFKSWFKTRNKDLLDRIFQILRSPEGDQNGDELASIRATDSALSQLGLRLNEPFVLEVLRQGSCGDVLPCLKFFDWAGRQPGFHHTRGTFIAIFRILSRAKLMSLMFDFLDAFKKRRYAHKVRFHDTLVIGYAVAGKPELALFLFGKMRFQGLDLDYFAYHILLNALVEESCFNGFDVIVNQIRMRGYENHVTNAVIMKSLCKQNRLDEAEAHLDGLASSGKELNGSEVTVLIDALCKSNKFEHALKLVEKFGKSGLVLPENAYGVWIKDLVQAGRLDVALEFVQQKKTLEGYVPTPVQYNILICRLLRDKRLLEVYDLLIEMKEKCIPPDMFTMNNVLSFFCKAGVVDVALELYNSRSQFGLSPNHMAYNCLIFTLFQDNSINEAYSVLKNSIDQGYFPDRQTFSAVASALCRGRKIDEMKELLSLALERNIVPCASMYDKFISALCRAGRVEDGYLIHGELNNATTRGSYVKLIKGFCKSNRGDIAAQLLIEMQRRGHKPTRPLFRAVVCCLLHMDNPKAQFFNLLEILSHEADCEIYNFFLDGAGHSKKPEWAREVFELMQRNGIEPNLSSQILMLQSYLKSERISDALNFFNDLGSQGIVKGKLYNTLIVSLCKAHKADIALEHLSEMKKAKLTPSIECYEVLVQQLCSMQRYHESINLINEYEKMGRKLTSFLGNVLLLHSLSAPQVYNTCVRLREVKDGGFSGSPMLGLIIDAFSGHLGVDHHIENLEELIAKCFPLDRYTYNLLLRKVSKRPSLRPV